MQHPPRLGWATTLPAGYEMDRLGQVRHTASGDLVCGWSGRGHREYLLPLPWPDPATGLVRVVMVDRDSMAEIRRGVEAHGRRLAGRGLRSVVRRLLSEGLGIILGRVLR